MMFLLDMTLEEAWDFYESSFTEVMELVTDITDNDDQFRDDYIHDILELYGNYYMVLSGMIGYFRSQHVQENYMLGDVSVYYVGPDTIVVDVQYEVG